MQNLKYTYAVTIEFYQRKAEKDLHSQFESIGVTYTVIYIYIYTRLPFKDRKRSLKASTT